MPHCLIECPTSLKAIVDFDILVKAVHDGAEATGLFSPNDVKSRLLSYQHDIVGGRKQDYVHVTIGLLGGRTKSQKGMLARTVVGTICDLLPDVHFISVDVRDFCAQSYANRASLAESS